MTSLDKKLYSHFCFHSTFVSIFLMLVSRCMWYLL